jgi:transposase
MSVEGILHCDIQVGAYTAEAFDHFVEALLAIMNPFPQQNSVLVMDNAAIHKSDRLVQMCEGRWVIQYFPIIILIFVLYSGVRLEYLPPYSPDFNPIEEAFSSIKAWLRRNRAHSDNEFASQSLHRATDLLMAAVYSVTAEKARSWFHHSGYL